MKKIVFVTPEDASKGFNLAGVRQHVAIAADLPAALVSLAADPSTGLVAIDERLVDPAVQRAIDDVDRRWPALVVVLPAPATAAAPVEDYALRLVRKAIGYQVRVDL